MGAMNWFADPKKQQAMSDKGYVIKWVDNAVRGTFFNAYTPSGKHIEGSHDKEKCKTRCEEHFANSAAEVAA
jgi:hypothetical protein